MYIRTFITVLKVVPQNAIKTCILCSLDKDWYDERSELKEGKYKQRKRNKVQKHLLKLDHMKS